MGLRKLFLLEFFGRAVPLGVDDGSLWAYVKAGATFLAEIGVYVKANFDFPFNSLFRTLFGTGATSGTIVADTVGHGYKDSVKRQCENLNLDTLANSLT